MCCFGGFLGFCVGNNLDLCNFIFLFIIFDIGDIVFFISDGVFDNFDFVILQCEIFFFVYINSFDLMLDELRVSERIINVFLDESGSDYDLLWVQLYDFVMVKNMIEVNDFL